MKRRDKNKSRDADEADRLRNRLEQRINRLIATSNAGAARSAEQRAMARSATRLVGVISGAELPETSCLVTERSAQGFRILLHEAAELPDEIHLKIPSLGLDGVVRKRWKQETEVGVEFIVWDGDDAAVIAPGDKPAGHFGDTALRLPDEDAEK